MQITVAIAAYVAAMILTGFMAITIIKMGV
jgi:hypothetical protein